MWSSEWLAVAFGLSSALTWGAGDFAGGMASRRQSVFSVILFSQAVGGAMLITAALVLSEHPPTLRQLAMGGAAGIIGTTGLAALYLGLATGRMGIVAPLSAVVGTVLPILFAAVHEGLPAPSKLVGFGAALLAVCCLCYQKDQGRFNWKVVVLPLAAGLCSGLFFVIIGQISKESVLWPMSASRFTSVTLLAAYFLVHGRPKASTGGGQWGLILLAGVLETSGSVLFALAAGVGRLDISAVLASLYPAGTVVLAGMVLKEKLSGRHWAGVGAALAALVLIAG